MSAPTDTMRAYDAAVDKWLSSVRVNYELRDPFPSLFQVPLFVMKTSPAREFSGVGEMLVRRGIIPAPTDEFSRKQVRDIANAQSLYKIGLFPFARYEYLNGAIDVERAAVPFTHYADRKGFTWFKRALPRPYNHTYMIEFMALEDYTIDHLVEWVMRQAPLKGAGAMGRFINVQHPHPYGVKQAEVQIDDVSSSSDTEAFDADNRLLRRQVYVTIKGWDFDLEATQDTSRQVKAILSVQTDIRDPQETDRLGVYIGEPNSSVVANATQVYDASPVPYSDIERYSNVEPLTTNRNDARHIVYMSRPDQFIELNHLPIHRSMHGGLRVSWLDTDNPSTPPEPLSVSVLLRDTSKYDGNAAPFVYTDAAALTWNADVQGNTFYWTALPGPLQDVEEVSVRITHPANSTRRYAVVLDQCDVRYGGTATRWTGPTSAAVSQSGPTVIDAAGLTPGTTLFVSAFFRFDSMPAAAVVATIYDGPAQANVIKSRSLGRVARGAIGVRLVVPQTGTLRIAISSASQLPTGQVSHVAAITPLK